MATRFLAVCAGVSLGLCLVRAAEEAKRAPKVDAAAMARLITQLGSDRYEDRESASKELDALGQNALEALRPALTNRDVETRRRARDLVERIEKRLESAQLTQPKLVRLVYNDTPVMQAVQDMARKSGFTIQIDGDQAKLAERKITLDTGEVPFWQAVDQFCLKAGLVERGPVAISEDAMPEMRERYEERLRMWRSAQERGGGLRPEKPLVLHDGTPQAFPTYYGGSLRVRVPARAISSAGAPQNGIPVNRPDLETLLSVEVTPEPKMGWQNILSVRVDKMLDEQGNEMKLPLPYIPDAFDFDDPTQNLLSKQVLLYVHVTKGTKRIKEIHGAVAAEVLTPMQPLMTIDDVLNSAGRTALASDGSSLKVVAVKRDATGQVSLKVVMEKRVPDGVDAMGLGATPPIVWGGFDIPTATDKNTVARKWVLKDNKGVAYPLGSVTVKSIDNLGIRVKPMDDLGTTVEYDLKFPANNKTTPAKLEFLGQRLTTIDVAFVLKDVPVP
jgi:hypothetical protein